MITIESASPRWRRRATSTLAATGMVAAGLFALAGPASAADPTTIYVNSAGSTAPDCGASFKACKTIQAGIDNASAGDTVQVAAGTYNGLVNITKGVTVKGEDKASTFIDGTGLTTPNGLVTISQPGGDVTISGFTIENQVAPGGGNDDSYGIVLNDSNAEDTITISDNIFPGDSPARTEENPYGVNSANTLATQVISNNEFANLWRGVLLEGNNGPVNITDNVFHDLIAVPTGADSGDDVGKFYPPKGVYILADGSGGVSDQSITGNTFRDYAGIGVSIRAGYDLGGCADRTCEGSVSASATKNTFQLDPQSDDNSVLANQQVAAFNVQALDDVDVLELALSGNVGTVPGKPLIVAPGDGTVTVTPTPSPLTLTPATATVTAGARQTFTATLTDVLGNPDSGVEVSFDNGEGPGLLNRSTSTTDEDGEATVMLVTSTGDTGNGTVTAKATPASGDVTATSTYTVKAPVSVASTTPTLGTIAKAGGQQVVNVKVTNTDGTAPAAGTEVDLLVSGATVTNGTVFTDANGNATFTFTAQHKGLFTVKAVAGGKSGSVSGTTPIRNVITTIGLASRAKGSIFALARTYAPEPGAIVAFYFVQNGKYVFFHNVKTNAAGEASITANGRVSGGTYSMAARVVNNPDTDSVYSATKSIKIR